MADQNFRVKRGLEVGIGGTVISALSSGSVGIGTINPLYRLTVTTSGATVTPSLSNVIADFTANTNSFSQINTRNASNGANASTDIIATADTGTDTTNYIDLGINNSAYSVAGWTINGALDGYLYTSDTNLSIGAAAANKYVSIFTGGTLAANERLRITGIGSVGIGTTNPTSKLTVQGDCSANTYLYSHLSLGNISGITTINLNTAASFSAKVTGITTFQFTNPTGLTSSRSIDFIIELTNGGSYTITFPTSVNWENGVTPTLTGVGTDLIGFFTNNTGTDWAGSLLLKDIR